jgi:cysteinyl-tRNA synthetase
MIKHLIGLLSLLTLFTSCSKEKRSDKAAAKMQQFVINIANYARNFNQNFIIIPQNGVELAFNNQDPNDGINDLYVSTVSGFGVEEVFYNGVYNPDNYRIDLLKSLPENKPVLISEYVKNDNDIYNAFNKVNTNGWLCFVRKSNNYYYEYIPDTIFNENSNDITTLLQAKNYLYLINNNQYANKQEMLNAIAATNFDVVLIDLFFNETAFTKSEIESLKTKANGGKRLVISYINIGAAENWRYYWKDNWKLHHPNWLKKKYDGYEDEFWVKFWKKEWQDIIYGNDNSYIKRIIDAGFDGAYLDNVEAYYFLYFD